MNPLWLLRMSRWARHPPSPRRAAFVLGVVALCLGLAGAEWLGLFPDWLGIEPQPRRLPRIQPLP